jgi:hypothetical protein
MKAQVYGGELSTLTALSAEPDMPDILSAGIYTKDGKIFASYAREGQTTAGAAALPVVSAASR